MRHPIQAFWTIFALVCAVSLPAYAAETSQQTGSPAASTAAGNEAASQTAATQESEPVCTQCGTIIRIESKTREGKASGVGAATGAVLGAIAGREIVGGSRSSRNAAAVAGAVGGGYAGHKIEENAKTENYYLISVEMESDSRIEVVKVDSIEGWASGDKVRVVEGSLYKR